jgi:uncharacterized membrane protein
MRHERKEDPMQATTTTITPPAAPAPSLQDRISDTITTFCGDIRFVYLHAAFFAVWIATKGFGSDTFPFNFLTMAVSLEAIFLSTFILISQNRQQAAADAHNEMVQQALIKMLNDVVSDEKLDQMNEKMIAELLRRLDVERVQPIAQHVASIADCVARIEQRLPPAPASA